MNPIQIKKVEAKPLPPPPADGDIIQINTNKKWKARKPKLDFTNVENLPQPPPQATATPYNVTLGDCLACSGCITSVETVLIADQSHEKVLKVLDDKANVSLL